MSEVKMSMSEPRITAAQRPVEAEARVLFDRWVPASLALDMAMAGMSRVGDLLADLGRHFDPAKYAEDDSVMGQFRRLVDAAVADAIVEAPPYDDPTVLGRMAHWYAETLRWPVFPLQPRSKAPYPGSRGVDDATTDLAMITAWWQHAPDSNIGLACGHTIDVIDLDGPAGMAAMLQMKATGQLPPTVGIAVTGAGWHLYYPAQPGRRNTVNHVHRGDGEIGGVDTRALGGYVVAPPSIHPKGMRYQWRQAPYQTEPPWPVARPITIPVLQVDTAQGIAA
jgi:hypothetical protein